MKRYNLLLSLLVGLIIGCEDYKPDAKEFPLIITLSPTNVNKSGATLHGELLHQGELPTKSYGFLWSDIEPRINNANKVVLGEDIKSGTFETRIDSALAEGVEYKVKVFATYSDKTVYGNTITFKSKGSEKSAWSLVLSNLALNESRVSIGNANNDYGSVIFGSSHTYVYDPVKNDLIRSVDFPLLGNNRFTSVFIDNRQYYFCYMSRNLYKLEDETWSVQSVTPFNYGGFGGGYFLGFSYSNKIYILSTWVSYMYNPETDTWQTRSKVPSWVGNSVGGTMNGNKAWVITKNKDIWEYDIDNDNWIKKTTYPGSINGYVMSFYFNNKIYFGFSHPAYFDENQSKWMDRKLWSYDLNSEKWIALENFPVILSYGGVFFFSLKDYFYLGYQDRSGTISLWKFDPSKYEIH